MELSFEQRVKEAKLTKTEKRISEYFLQNPSIVTFQSVGEVAQSTGSSDVTVIRFARALGYEGFAEMKRALQREMIIRIDEAPESMNTVAKYVVNKRVRPEEPVLSTDTALAMYTNLIRNTLQYNSDASFEIAARHLLDSRKKYIIGFRSRIGAAETTFTLLQNVMEGVDKITGSDYQSYLKFLDISDKDAVLLFRFGRYSQFEKQLLLLATSRGAYRIFVTDQKDGPGTEMADLVLYAGANTRHLFYSSVGLMVAAEILVDRIANMNWEQSHKRLEITERLINSETVES